MTNSNTNSTNNKSTTAKQLLAQFLYTTCGIKKTVKTKSGLGFMIYEVQKVTDLQHLTSLVEALDNGWTLISSPERYKPNGDKTPAAIYIGEARSKNDITDLDAFCDIIAD